MNAVSNMCKAICHLL